MLKRVKEKTWPVLGRRDAKTVDAINAALVLRLAGIFLVPVLIPRDDDAGDP